jgi:hypothetical protein
MTKLNEGKQIRGYVMIPCMLCDGDEDDGGKVRRSIYIYYDRDDGDEILE